MVFQNPDDQLFMTKVYDDIAFGPRNELLDEHVVEERVVNAMEQLGITPPGSDASMLIWRWKNGSLPLPLCWLWIPGWFYLTNRPRFSIPRPDETLLIPWTLWRWQNYCYPRSGHGSWYLWPGNYFTPWQCVCWWPCQRHLTGWGALIPMSSGAASMYAKTPDSINGWFRK